MTIEITGAAPAVPPNSPPSKASLANWWERFKKRNVNLKDNIGDKGTMVLLPDFLCSAPHFPFPALWWCCWQWSRRARRVAACRGVSRRVATGCAVFSSPLLVPTLYLPITLPIAFPILVSSPSLCNGAGRDKNFKMTYQFLVL